MRSSLRLLDAGVRHSHVYLPVSGLERSFLAAGSALISLADPKRADMVAMLGETTGARALAALRDGMRASRDGAWLLEHRPRIAGPRFCARALAAAHAPHTLGGAYARFMLAHAFSADARAPVRLVADSESAYVMTRYREVHDFWHVLAGLPPTVLGEVALKWFEAAVTGLPSAALAAAGGPLRLTRAEATALRTRLAPWALAAAARTAVPLLCVRYEDLLHEPLDAVREKLRFLPAPAEASALPARDDAAA
jgi:ubiquinone biosynthesis protein COQ4